MYHVAYWQWMELNVLAAQLFLVVCEMSRLGGWLLVCVGLLLLGASYLLFERVLLIAVAVLYAYCRLVKLFFFERGARYSKQQHHLRIGPFIYWIYVVLLAVFL